MSWSISDVLNCLKENPRVRLEDLAKRYNVTKQAISDKLKKSGLNWRELKYEAIRAQLERYVIDHPRLTREQLERDFNLTYEAIRAEFEKYGLKLVLYRERKITKEDLENYMKENPLATIYECAEHFSVSYNTMIRRFREYGLTTKIDKRKERENVSKNLEEEKLREFVEEHPGFTVNKLANIFKVNPVTMKKYLTLYGIELTSPRNIIIKRKKIEDFLRENPYALIGELAEHFGLSRYLMKRHLDFYGIRTLRKKVRFTKEDLEEYIKDNPDATQTDIAKHFKVSESAIWKYLKLYGLKSKGMRKREDEKGQTFTREELLSKILQILNSVNGVSVKRLKIFLQSKGIDISEEEIIKYQNELLEQKRKNDEGR